MDDKRSYKRMVFKDVKRFTSKKPFYCMVEITYRDNLAKVDKEVFYNAVEIKYPKTTASRSVMLIFFLVCLVMVCVIVVCLKYKTKV